MASDAAGEAAKATLRKLEQPHRAPARPSTKWKREMQKQRAASIMQAGAPRAGEGGVVK